MADLEELKKSAWDLPKRLKEKYPKAYGDIPDNELLSLIGKKYPKAYGKAVDIAFGTITKEPYTIKGDIRNTILREKLKAEGVPEEKLPSPMQPPKRHPLAIAAKGVSVVTEKVLKPAADISEKLVDESFGLILDRPFGALRNLAAGRSPWQGYLRPEEAPTFGESIVNAWGIKDDTTAFWLGGLLGTGLDLASYHYVLKGNKKLFGKVSSMYSGAQRKSLLALKAQVVKELRLAGIDEANAGWIADGMIRSQMQKLGIYGRSPGAINRALNELKSREGQVAAVYKDYMQRVAENAAKEGFTSQWMDKAMTTTPSLTGRAKTALEYKTIRLKAPPEQGPTITSKIELTPEDTARSVLTAVGGKLRGISGIDNSVYKGEQTVYFETPKGKVKSLPISKVTPVSVRRAMGYEEEREAPIKPKIPVKKITGVGASLSAEAKKFKTAEEFVEEHRLFSGVVDLRDGKIEQFFTVDQSRNVGGSHSELIDSVAPKLLDGVETGEKGYFWINDSGGVETWERGLIPFKIQQQIAPLIREAELEKNKQLTDIWNKAVKVPKVKAPKPEPPGTVLDTWVDKRVAMIPAYEKQIDSLFDDWSDAEHKAFDKQVIDKIGEMPDSRTKIKGISPEATEPIVNITPPMGVEPPKEGTPFRPEIRVEEKLFSVELQTAKGVTITQMTETQLANMEAALAEAIKTQKPPMHNGIPVAKIMEKFAIDFGDLGSEGFVKLPGAAVIKKVYRELENAINPVGVAPRDAARAIAARHNMTNVLVHDVYRIRKAVKSLVPDSKQREVVSAYIEPGGIEATKGLMTPEMLTAARLIEEVQRRFGLIAKDMGVITKVLENYMKHLIVDKDLTIGEMDSMIRQAMSTKKISKYVDSKHPRVRTETGEIMYPTIASLEAAGIEVVTKDAADLMAYTLMSEGMAIINARLVDVLSKIPYIDPKHPNRKLFQVMSFAGKTKLPSGFKVLRRGVFTMKWASPEVFDAISSVANPPMGGKALAIASSTAKRIKFLFPFIHGWNIERNAIMNRGILLGFKMYYDGSRLLADPEYVDHLLKMGVNLFRVNKMAGDISNEFLGLSAKYYLPGKVSEALFVGMGDTLAASTANLLEQQMQGKGLSEKEMHEVVASISNNQSGHLSPHTMSRFGRDIGRIFLIARDWTFSNIREGIGALGKHPKYWSAGQRAAATQWYRTAFLRLFMHIFVASNIINYLVSKHHYGKGRWTWENEGRIDYKINPLIYVDKNTGREYIASNMYGSFGDIMHWVVRGPTTLGHKSMIYVKEFVEQIANRDLFTGEKIWRDSDNFVQGMAHKISHAAETILTPAGVTLRDRGKYPTPPIPKIVRFLGIAVGSAAKHQESLDELLHYKERKKYKIRDVDQLIYRKISEGDKSGAMEVIRKEKRYQSVEGIMNLMQKMRNPVKSLFNTMSTRDKVEFTRSLSPEKRIKFRNAMRD